ncbi:MAG: thioredoxin domain-containing protein, partial [Rhodospirillaceae bacterium]|nr:thioredoxin domain-containing protein [Rhodospirillaceae bacterium]
PGAADTNALLATLHAAPAPHVVLSIVERGSDLPPAHPAAGKAAIAGSATAYVCRNRTCSAPVTEPEELADLLASNRRSNA